MKSTATTVEEYIAELPEDRKAAITTVHEMVLANLPEGYETAIAYGMIGYVVPKSIYPAGYHCDPKLPLLFMALASQKNYMSLYLHSVYGNDVVRDAFIEEYKKTGRKLDMGQACLRFKKVDELALDVIGKTVSSLPVATYLAQYEAMLATSKSKKRA